MKPIANDDDFIPGTINIYAFELRDDEGGDHHKTRSGLKTEGNIILVPQPSDSVNDPLNWLKYKKFWNFMVVAFITGFTAATANDAGAVQESLNELYGISYDAMNTGAGVLFISIGTGCFVLAPCSNLYGRKITYFICIFLGLLGAVWFALSKRTSDTIWSQLFVGVSELCAEAQAQLSISDLYYQHQLGASLTVYILATSVGTYLGPLIAGFIVQYAGFRWVGWIAAIILGGLIIVILFGMHETYFDRRKYRGVLDLVRSSEPVVVEDEKKHPDDVQSTTSVEPLGQVYSNGASEPKKSWWDEVKLITPGSNIKGTGFKQYLTQLKLLFRVFMFPPVIFSGLVWGIQDVLLTFYLTVEDDQYYDPPYSYSNVGVALMNVPCLIGAIIGCFFAGIVSDWFTIWMARRNNGVQEAEYRLWFLLLPAVIAPVGLILFAVGTDQHWHWGPTYVGLGFIGFGFGASGDVAMSYLMDAYPQMVIEMMVGVAIINNYISCVFTFTCSMWLRRMSNTNTFAILAVIEFLIMMGAVPMMIYGKRIRRWTKDWYTGYCDVRDGI